MMTFENLINNYSRFAFMPLPLPETTNQRLFKKTYALLVVIEIYKIDCFINSSNHWVATYGTVFILSPLRLSSTVLKYYLGKFFQ